MQKVRIKILSVLLICFVLLSSFSFLISAADKTYGDWTYSVSGSNATITGYSGNATTITIPSTLNGYTVKSIAGGVFSGNTKITSLSIPSTVTAIGTNGVYNDGVFENCKLLQTVSIAKGSEDAYIGHRAFLNCISLDSISVPGNYITIRERAFEGCSALGSVVLNKTSYSTASQEIGNAAFYNCSSLSSVSLPTTLKVINSSAFEKCIALTSVTIPEGVTSLGTAVFADCTKLKTVSIPSTMTELGTNGIYNVGAFEGCKLLQTVTIAKGASEAYVGNRAFLNCVSLKEITIPGNYIVIRERAFESCTALESASLNKTSYKTATQEIGNSAFYNCSSLVSVSLPTTLKVIHSSAFEKCIALTSVTIPEGVTALGTATFANCTKLKTVSIPSTMKELGTNGVYNIGAFEGCKLLETVTIPEGADEAYIGNRAFKDCASLKSISVPGNYLYIKENAFANCTVLTSLVYGENEYGSATQEIGVSAFYNCSSLLSVSLPTTLKVIHSSAFEKCIALTNVTIPEGVTALGTATFAGCTMLKTVSIPSTMSELGTNGMYNVGAFEGCKLLEKVIIAPGTKEGYIGHRAFKDCIALTYIYIPERITEIRSNAFQNCGQLIIYGISGSTAHQYAASNSIKFKASSTPENGEDDTVSVSMITVSPSSMTLNIGGTRQLSVSVYPTNATNQSVTYKSLNTSVATVTSSGIVTAVSSGTATIRVTSVDGGKTADCTVTVNKENGNTVSVSMITVSPSSMTLDIGSTRQLSVSVYPTNATNQSVTYKSLNTSVATVTSSGIVTAVSSGTATIRVTSVDGGKTADCTVTVKKSNDNTHIAVTSVSVGRDFILLEENEQTFLYATVYPSNATNQNLTWESTNPAVATVNEYGIITANRVGTARIYVRSVDSGVYDYCEVTVTEPEIVKTITLSESSVKIQKGKTITVTAEVIPEDKVVWTSSNTSVATVDENGTITAVGMGKAVITASCESDPNINATIDVDVTFDWTSLFGWLVTAFTLIGNFFKKLIDIIVSSL